MLMHNEIRESITNSIVEHLESGKVAPWRRPWTFYLNGWLENMKSDPKFIFSAAAQAAKAADFVLHFSREPVEEREPAIVF